MLNTPILFLVFNRLDTTKKVFAKIREIQPSQLFIGSDGAREEKKGESEKVEAVRKYILENIDWDCEIKTLFRDKNLGCGLAVSQAITWFFEQVEQGIILEDDCLPDLSFFGFCEELLNYYKDDNRVMHISGNNFQFGRKRGKASYYISKYATIWGWATWKRAWQKYDFKLENIDKSEIASVLKNNDFNKSELIYWNTIFLMIIEGNIIDTWDYQWMFIIWFYGGLSIVPNTNLISNIGFNEDATHVKSNKHRSSNIPTESMPFPVKKVGNLIVCKDADEFIFNNSYDAKPTLFFFLKARIKKIITIILLRR